LNLLLDTHIWIWSKLDPKRIGKGATRELSNNDNDLWLSPVSVWEALALMQKGRIRVGDPLVSVERAADQLREVPLTRKLFALASRCPCLTLIRQTDSSRLPPRF
jgi:PIN domain nuclease of toxin-antitoxin system